MDVSFFGYPNHIRPNIIGSKYEELIDVREIMLSMLKESGPPPKGKWDALKYLNIWVLLH